jgi:transmembrane sensor
MDRRVRSKLNTQIYEEACEWFVECRGGSLDEVTRRELDRWLRKSPEHLSAYLEIAALWNEGPLLDPTNKWDTDTLIAQVVRDSENVIALSCASPDEVSPGMPVQGVPTAPPGHKRRALLTLAASIVAISLALGWLLWLQKGAPTYTTAIGEQRSIVLSDGSTVALNSRSGIKIRFSKHERTVELIQGQALFHVAKDSARPFTVSADGTRVRAVGTQFDVYRKYSGTVITVVEGRVAVLAHVAPAAATVELQSPPVASDEVARRPSGAVSSPDLIGPAREPLSGRHTLFLVAGEQLIVTAKAYQKTDHPNIAGATAWTQRQLVFDSASLSDVAAEFNRYNTRRLVIEDPNLYDFHISGVFSSADPDALIRFLRERPGVRVTETESEIRIAKK